MCTSVHLHTNIYVVVGSRKRPRSSQGDEGVPDLKQREALSDQSNFEEDIGPAPAVIKRHYAVRKKSSIQAKMVYYYVHNHIDVSTISSSPIIPKWCKFNTPRKILNQAGAWFLKIDIMRTLYLCVSAPGLLKTIHVK